RVVFIETDDAGALFRFTDIYPRMYGGHMWVAMDPPSQSATPQDGILYVRNFTVRGEAGLDRLVAGAPGQAQDGVKFSEMHAEFTRRPGRMSVRDGVLRGPLVGITMEGQINYARNDVHLRGTFVPFYGLNNMFGQIPIVGLVLGGGSNEGLVGITYEAVGPPSAPRILVNPVSAIAPGLLRKFIPGPGAFDPRFEPPSR
ncbi:MAG TPA: AsmA-like C-terminal region-containing protein, partial [Pseudolabrys sp.]|nr:AsmA-like C-terminal region-containing protein [Pseudolabrys sp.]